MFAAPFYHVGFADFWLADQLNSLVGALLDFQFLICFYFTNGNWLEATGLYYYKHIEKEIIFFVFFLDTSQCGNHNFTLRPIVNCIPAWIRFAQCLRRYRDTKEAFPHLVNAGKYSSTFFVVIFGTLKNVYKGTAYIKIIPNSQPIIFNQTTTKTTLKIPLSSFGSVPQL